MDTCHEPSLASDRELIRKQYVQFYILASSTVSQTRLTASPAINDTPSQLEFSDEGGGRHNFCN